MTFLIKYAISSMKGLNLSNLKLGGNKLEKKVIHVKVAIDQEFENSFWSYDIQKELKKAFREFKRQFGVKLRITEFEEWNSIGSPFLRDSPLNIVRGLPKGSSEEELIENLIKAVNKRTELPLEISQEVKEKLKRVLRRKSRAYRFGYLVGYLDYRLKGYLLEDLARKIQRGQDEMIIGFTGKIFPHEYRILAGVASQDCALIGICNNPSNVILHEIGHVFGAKDVEDKSIRSVMNIEHTEPIYEFDEKNKEIISKNLGAKFKS